MCEDPGIHLLRPHMWCLEIGTVPTLLKGYEKGVYTLIICKSQLRKKNCTVCAVCDYKIGLTLRGRPLL